MCEVDIHLSSQEQITARLAKPLKAAVNDLQVVSCYIDFMRKYLSKTVDFVEGLFKYVYGDVET